MITILIVEDEEAICDLIKINLENQGYKCDTAVDGEIASDYIENKDYDLILADIMMPKVDGYELLKYIKQVRTNTPIIFITAKSQIEDKLKGLNKGADDYITKPFDIREVIARIETVLRRYNKGNENQIVGDININIIARTVKKDNVEINLTPKEFDLLVLLVQNKNFALYRETIFEKVWGEELEFETRTLDLHIQRLRKKLGWKDKIKTVYKIGYMLEV